MKVERIRLKNFKTFADVTIEGLQPYTVFVGSNGSGKTTLFGVFGFLRDCLKENVGAALNRRGGFREVVSRGHENETIRIEVQIRMQIADKERLVTYVLEISNENNSPLVEKEILQYKRGRHGRPFKFLDFSHGSGSAITNESEFADDDTQLVTDHQSLDSPQILAIKGLGQFSRFIAANAFRNLIENWHVSDFNISSARSSQDAGHAEHLSAEGENLPLVTQYMYENHRAEFERMLKAMEARVPGVKNVEARRTDDGRIVLRFKDGNFSDPFVSRFVSDGTIKMFAYLVLLYDPKPHPLLCVEEPENQLYPTLLGELAEEFADYAERGGQVFVSTHSPDFLNSVPLDSIFILSKTNGFTAVSKASDDANLASLVKEGDQPGYLWRQGAFKGVDP
jgi:predicted ATPase